MPDRDDRDRPRDEERRPGERDWRDLDRRKDRSLHRKEDRPKAGPRSKAMQQAAQKEYRTGLEKLFESGTAGGRVAKLLEKLPAAGGAPGEGQGAERQVALRRIRAAETSLEVKAAVDAFRERWDMPEDPDALVQVLLHPDEAVVAEALGVLDGIMPLRRPARRETMRMRLRRIGDDEDLSSETRGLAVKVREKA